MYLCTRRKIWTLFSCLVLLKCYHVVFSQFKIPANLAQLAVPKMHCLYANAVVQPSVQHCPCYMAWKTKVHTWCRHCHLCINAPMWGEKRWLQGIIDPPSYNTSMIWYHQKMVGLSALCHNLFTCRAKRSHPADRTMWTNQNQFHKALVISIIYLNLFSAKRSYLSSFCTSGMKF